MTRSSISAAVLIGGRSHRMGRPKALLRLAPGNQMLIERTVATVRKVSDDVFLVGASGWPLPAALDACPLAIDAGNSAADGLVTALNSAAHRYCIVVACDMPFLDEGLLRTMCDMALVSGRGVIATDGRGAHPLHAVWDVKAAPLLAEQIAQGQRSLGNLARLADLAPLDLDEPDWSEQQRWSVFNVNTPEDLAVAQARATGTS